MVPKETVQELSTGDFSDFISHKGLSLIKFYAEWCMPCVMMAPIFETVADENKKAKFAQINIDEAQELAQKYKVETIPHMIFFKDGKEVDRQNGSCSEDKLNEIIKKHIK